MFRRQAGLVAVAAIFFFPQVACSKSGPPSKKAQTVQGSVVAGQFYPGDPAQLRKMVEGFIADAPKKAFTGTIIGLIAPHAGYPYSGPIAGAAFKQIEGKKYARVVVIAPSHHVFLPGAALSTRDVYRTPLGDIPIDTASVKKLIGEHPWATGDEAAYAREHALEVELPFLQVSLGDFLLVPIIVGAQDPDVLNVIADGLNEMFPGDDTLFVASTDLSHYLPYQEAEAADRKTIAFICERDTKAYAQAVGKGEAKLCGSSPVAILKRIAEKRQATLKLIEQANSGDTAGDKSRVVGYAAIAAVVPEATLSEAQRQELLKLARTTLVAHVEKKPLPPLPRDPTLKKDGAAFVTLKKKGELRGCIGQIIAQQPLDLTVQAMTIAAASQDPRFQPVRPEELREISIEISVLTPPTDLPDPLAVRVGQDGLIVEKGFNRGVLLPQVPTEQGWTREQFLEGICHKAGMSSDCWKEAKLKRFQAIVFGEKE